MRPLISDDDDESNFRGRVHFASRFVQKILYRTAVFKYFFSISSPAEVGHGGGTGQVMSVQKKPAVGAELG